MPNIPAQSRTISFGPPTPEELASAALYGITHLGDLGLVQRRVWAEQEAFLAEYRKHGMKGTCAIRAGIHRETVRLWERGDMLHFNARIKDALEVYVDMHDERLTELAMTTLQPLPTIAKLNAYRTDLYKPELKREETNTRAILAALQQLATTDLRAIPAKAESVDSDGVSVEGKVVSNGDVGEGKS